MKNNQISITKTLIKEILIERLCSTNLEIEFLKFNHRAYYFSTIVKGVLTYIAIKVNINKGTMYCQIITAKNAKVSMSLINDSNSSVIYLVNSEKKGNTREMLLFHFSQNGSSFEEVVLKLIEELKVQLYNSPNENAEKPKSDIFGWFSRLFDI